MAMAVITVVLAVVQAPITVIAITEGGALERVPLRRRPRRGVLHLVVRPHQRPLPHLRQRQPRRAPSGQLHVSTQPQTRLTVSRRADCPGQSPISRWARSTHRAAGDHHQELSDPSQANQDCLDYDRRARPRDFRHSSPRSLDFRHTEMRPMLFCASQRPRFTRETDVRAP